MQAGHHRVCDCDQPARGGPHSAMIGTAKSRAAGTEYRDRLCDFYARLLSLKFILKRRLVSIELDKTAVAYYSY